MPSFIVNERGQVVGSIAQLGATKTYSDAKGRPVARVHDGRTTTDANGRFKGFGDQGLRVLGEKLK